jgi:His-Xaa-Ser system protein HxsD
VEIIVKMTSETITVDGNIFSIETIKKTALRYSGHYWIDITHDAAVNRSIVTLTPKTEAPFSPFITSNFRQDLLDQDLREIVAKETHVVTNLILAQAFSNILEPEFVKNDLEAG